MLAIGTAAGFALDAGQVVAALLGIVTVAALWWAYFDVVAIVAERRLIEAPPGEQAPLARDAYSYLHFPMIAGIVLLAVGLRETLAGSEPLDTVPAVALCGGTALYLAGHIGFRLRTLGTFSPHRALATLALLALIPLALGADSLGALAAVAAVLIVLIAYEAVHFRGGPGPGSGQPLGLSGGDARGLARQPGSRRLPALGTRHRGGLGTSMRRRSRHELVR